MDADALAEGYGEEQIEMSEVDKILGQFRTARYFERAKSAQEPSVCVAGKISYLELENAISLMFGSSLTETGQWLGFMDFEGIKIYMSHSIEEGFHFGHIEPRP